jgi:alpha-glucosidase
MWARQHIPPAARGRQSPWLGVDAVWLCPIYCSGMLDFGYDIIDYCDVDPLFGSLAGFDRLLEAMHGRGIKVLLDFVPNRRPAAR